MNHPGTLRESAYLNYTLSAIGGKYCGSILCLLAAHDGRMRFNELRRCMGDIPCKTLSSTLKKMEDDGLVLRREFPQIPPKVEYALTDRGTSLLPVLQTISGWGAAHFRQPPCV